jgi:hypothetical protein
MERAARQIIRVFIQLSVEIFFEPTSARSQDFKNFKI